MTTTSYTSFGIRDGVLYTITSAETKEELLRDTLEFVERHPFGEYSRLGMITVYDGWSASNIEELEYVPPTPGTGSLRETHSDGLGLDGGMRVH